MRVMILGRFGPDPDWYQLAKEVRPVYTAISEL